MPRCPYQTLEGLRGYTGVCIGMCVHLGLLYSQHWRWGSHGSSPISGSSSAGQEVVQAWEELGWAGVWGGAPEGRKAEADRGRPLGVSQRTPDAPAVDPSLATR